MTLRLLAALVLVAGLCTSCADPSVDASEPSTGTPELGEQVQPGVLASVTEAHDATSDIVVVLVPGGGWVSADPMGLRPLADHLAAKGATAVTLTYRTASDGAYFPLPVRDIGCGIAFAAQAASDRVGRDPTVVVVGHSTGAQLAAVAALDPTTATDPQCPYPPAQVDGLVGLAGPYDVTALAQQAANLFGPSSQRIDQWDAGNPVMLAHERASMPVLLIHGTADGLVPASLSEQFAEALSDGGHPVTLRLVEGVDHDTVYSTDVAGPPIAAWLGLTNGASPTPR